MKLARQVVPAATAADLAALPPTWRGEIIDGVLYASPRPSPSHANAGSRLLGDLDGPFQRGCGGPGGWWILAEPGLPAPRAHEFSPDVAGRRRQRLPRLPRRGPITLVPDWICEILSPSTRGYDQIVKRGFYAEMGVGHLWYVDVASRTLAVSRLHDGRWLELGVWGETAKVRAEPFEALEVDLAAWWEGVESSPDDEGED